MSSLISTAYNAIFEEVWSLDDESRYKPEELYYRFFTKDGIFTNGFTELVYDFVDEIMTEVYGIDSQMFLACYKAGLADNDYAVARALVRAVYDYKPQDASPCSISWVTEDSDSDDPVSD